MMYMEGKGVDQNSKVAQAKLYDAASQGLNQAWFELGMMYFEGKAGLSVWRERAGQYFTEGAMRGHLKSMQMLDDYPDMDVRRKEVEITVYEPDGTNCIGGVVKFEKAKNKYGAVTDYYGKARIKAKSGDQLQVMFIGCKTQYLNVGDSKSYVVRLKKN